MATCSRLPAWHSASVRWGPGLARLGCPHLRGLLRRVPRLTRRRGWGTEPHLCPIRWVTLLALATSLLSESKAYTPKGFLMATRHLESFHHPDPSTDCSGLAHKMPGLTHTPASTHCQWPQRQYLGTGYRVCEMISRPSLRAV